MGLGSSVEDGLPRKETLVAGGSSSRRVEESEVFGGGGAGGHSAKFDRVDGGASE